MKFYTKFGISGLVFFMQIAASVAAQAGTAKISDFVIIHSESVILASSSYAALNKLTDADLKKTVQTPQGGDFVTVKAGTKDLRDGNTRVYLLKKRGYGTLVVTFDEVDTGYRFYDD